MPATPIRSILVATDLGEGSDVLLRGAAALAEAAGAELHVLHSLELDSPPYGLEKGAVPSFQGRIERAERALVEQVSRAVPAGVPVRRRVINYAAHRAITECSIDARADLIVLGPHRGGEVAVEVLGSTADRVIRAAEVPCLLLRGPLELPLRRVGVPLDFSETSRAALRVAVDWAAWMGGPGADAAPELTIFHVASPIEGEDDVLPREEVLRRLEREVEGARAAEALPGAVKVETRTELGAAAGIIAHAREQGMGLLVMGTHGYGGLKLLLVGSVAMGVARQAPCPVLLVPPGFVVKTPVEPGVDLRRALLAVDFSETSTAAASWAVRHFVPDAEHVFLHVMDVAEPPAFLGGPTAGQAEEIREADAAAQAHLLEISRELSAGAPVRVRHGRAAEEIARAAGEEGVDLVVVGPHARKGIVGWLGSTAESLLAGSPAPVLLARTVPPGAPRRILAAVDESERATRVLAWARELRERFDADLEVLFAVEVMRYAPATELVGYGAVSIEAMKSTEESALQWLRERTAEAGLEGERVHLKVVSGEPGDEIVATAEERGAELIVMGSRGAGAVGRLMLGSVARSVLRHAPCPVFVLGDAAR